MIRVKQFAIGLSLLAMAPAGINAQSCLGLPSFSRGPANFRATYEDGNGASQIGAGLQLGGRTTFGGVTLAKTSFDTYDESALGLSVNLGTQIPLGAESRTAVCPLIEGGLGFGPDFQYFGSDYELRSRSIFAGVAIGTSIGNTPDFKVLPNAAIGFAYGGTKITVDGDELATGTDSYGTFRGGLGFLMGGRFALTPFVSVPIGLDGSDPSYGIFASIALGSRR